MPSTFKLEKRKAFRFQDLLRFSPSYINRKLLVFSKVFLTNVSKNSLHQHVFNSKSCTLLFPPRFLFTGCIFFLLGENQAFRSPFAPTLLTERIVKITLKFIETQRIFTFFGDFKFVYCQFISKFKCST